MICGRSIRASWWKRSDDGLQHPAGPRVGTRPGWFVSRKRPDFGHVRPKLGHEWSNVIEHGEITSRIVGRVLVIAAVMSLPRQVISGQFYLVTRRCTQRQFLLRPDAATNNAFTYCLIEAAQRTQVEVLLPCAMSNHHTVIYDRCGRYPEFAEHFHKMFARSQNALRGSNPTRVSATANKFNHAFRVLDDRTLPATSLFRRTIRRESFLGRRSRSA